MAISSRKPSALLALALAVPACGFPNIDPAGLGSDAALGSLGDAPSTDGGGKSCFASWRAVGLELHAPTALPAQTPANAVVRDPWVSRDGLRLYYDYQLTGGGSQFSEIYLATRASTDEAFATGVSIPELNGSSNQSRPSLSDDENTVVLSSDRLAAGTYSVLFATRDPVTRVFATPTTMYMDQVNTQGTNRFDPFLARNGLELYFAPSPVAPHNTQQVEVATRAALTSDFASPALLSINDAQPTADPAVSSDDSILLFSSLRDGNGNASSVSNLFYALRTTANDPTSWSEPQLIPNVNIYENMADPVLSADGCTLYFSAAISAGSYGLYSATVDTN